MSSASPFSNLAAGARQVLTEPADLDPSVHQWSQPEIDALTLALAAERPLLVRGEPGTGKTQLARAAAQHLGWELVTEVVHARFEASDLVYRFDAVRRLADAQTGRLGEDRDYWEPGVLWRAYGWDSAHQYGSCRAVERPPRGYTVLIDEIDKADSDLPNSLLEVLGQRSLAIAPLGLRVGGARAARPLVIITTNEERELPAAFMRRCIVLNLAPPPGASYTSWLLQRGMAHYGIAQAGGRPTLDANVIASAAEQLAEDRRAAEAAGLAPPGPAEFLDLLAALHRLAPGDRAEQARLIEKLSAYAYVKHGSVPGQPQLGQDRPPLPAAQG